MVEAVASDALEDDGFSNETLELALKLEDSSRQCQRLTLEASSRSPVTVA